MPLATTGETRVLNGLLVGVYVSLHTADPGNSGANQVSGGSYARQSAAFSNSGNNPTVASNSGAIQFPQASANWGTITHFGLWSAVSGGDFIGWGDVTTPRDIQTGDVARWEIGTLQVSAN